MNALVKIDSALPLLPIADVERAQDFARAEKAASTREAYASDFRLFEMWCSERGVSSLPATPATVAGYLASEADAGRAAATLGRRTAAIRYLHKLAELEPPTNSEIVKATLRGIRRTIGAAPKRKVAAVVEVIRPMIGTAPAGLKAKRDIAILLLGFAMAARRSELVALDVADLEFCDEGLRVRIRKSKTDQEKIGATVSVCHGGSCCPVRATKDWLTAAGITEGPIFRRMTRGGRAMDTRLTAQSVCHIVQAFAGRLGLKSKDFGAHSLRAGAITTAARRGASVFKIQEVSRHKSVDVLAGYVREADLFRDHCLAGAL